jgi:hypothetical protein
LAVAEQQRQVGLAAVRLLRRRSLLEEKQLQAVAMIRSIVLRTVIHLRRSRLQLSAAFRALQASGAGSNARFTQCYNSRNNLNRHG